MTKRLLVVSHAGVLGVNRVVFQNIAKVSDIDVRLIVPTRWKVDLIRDLKLKRSEEDRDISIFDFPVTFSRNGSLYFYRSFLKKVTTNFSRNYIFLDQEPWSLSAVQICLLCPHTKLAFYTKQNLRKRNSPPFPWFEKLVFSHAVHSYVVSDEVGDVLRDWKGVDRPIIYLPHSYDPGIFKEVADSARSSLRRSFGLRDDQLIVGYFGRLAEEKGLHDYFDAIRLLDKQKDLKNIFFWFMGNVTYPLRSFQLLRESAAHI